MSPARAGAGQTMTATGDQPGHPNDSRVTFEPGELATVLSRYDLGPLAAAGPLNRGSSRSPKAIIRAIDGNAYILKRLARHTDDIDRVRFAQRILRLLSDRGLPVAEVVPAIALTRDTERGWVEHNEHRYVLYQFVQGEHYRHRPEEAHLAGRALAVFHAVASDQAIEHAGYQPTYHDNEHLPRQLERIEEMIASPGIGRVVSRLRVAYRRAADRANECGFMEWPNQIIHGDWHPGNILFGNGSPPGLPTMIDLDTCRVSPRAVDLANGALQFSITRKRDDPGTWPAELDETLLKAFCTGYDAVEGAVISTGELKAMPWLMVEALIVESAVPIAASGSFAGIDGETFLQMICRKVAWIESSSGRLSASLG